MLGSLAFLLNPRVWIIVGALAVVGYAFDRGIKYEQRREAARIEATNKRIREVNAREEAVAFKEETEREKAFDAAAPVLAKADKCLATPEVAEALSRIQ